jgi:hypothetical protein
VEEMFLPDGEPVRVTRVEWDLLENGRWRWTAFADRRRLQSLVVAPEDLDKMLRLSRIFLKTMAEAERAA